MSVVEHPYHYNQHPSGVECIQIAEHLNFNLGSALKYLWRAGLKGDYVENLEKSIWCLKREISRYKKYQKNPLTDDVREDI
jgi:hypothetical protein